jgi:hypothetical protein
MPTTQPANGHTLGTRLSQPLLVTPDEGPSLETLKLSLYFQVVASLHTNESLFIWYIPLFS